MESKTTLLNSNCELKPDNSIRSVLQQVMPGVVPMTIESESSTTVEKQNSYNSITSRSLKLFSDYCIRTRSSSSKPLPTATGQFIYQNYAARYPRKHLSYDLTCDSLFASDYHFNVSEIQRVFGYEFCNYTLLLEALTHNSCINTSTMGSGSSGSAGSNGGYGSKGTSGGSYERLEYLGDAVLDLIVSNYLFKGCTGGVIISC